MQSLLIAVSLVSSAVALGMCAIVVKLLRDERRRSAARVEALASLARPEEPGADDAPVIQRREEPEREEPEIELRSGEPVGGVPDLFAERATVSPWGRRLGAAAACAAVITIGALGLRSWGRGADPGGPDTASVSATAPLELVSLRHVSEPKTITITGLVQNPRAGSPVSGVSAIALLFASDGAFLASGRAPLDFTHLQPGDESPFVVQVPVTARVARYRVSFRNQQGGVIGHVDRRNAGPLAQGNR